MNNKILLFLAILFSISSLSAQDVPETQKSLISKIAATWCGPCGGWAWGFFHDLEADNQDKALVIAVHHSGDLVSPTATALTTNFGSNSQPRFILNNSDQGASSGNAATKRMDIADKVNTNNSAAPVANSGLIATLDTDNNMISVNTNTKFFQAASGEYFLGLYVVENGVINYQASIGNGAVHTNVLRTSMNADAFGVPLSNGDIAMGTEISNSFSMAVNPTWNISNLSIAAIIWEKEDNSYQFVNTNSTDTFEAPVPSGINNIAAANWEMSIQPTISTGHSDIQINLPATVDQFQIKLFNQVGQLVQTLHNGQLAEGQHSFSIDTELNAGIYFVTSRNGHMVETKRLIVQ